VSILQLTPAKTSGLSRATDRPDGMSPETSVQLLDFRSGERLPQSQLKAVHTLHESFVRNLTSSLSIYLRSEVTGRLINVQPLTFGDFEDSLPVPTCSFRLRVNPYESYALVEMNQSLVAPVLDCVLGGTGKLKVNLDRAISDIEENMLEGLFGMVAHELTQAWKPFAPISFVLDTPIASSLLSGRTARGEAAIAVAIELALGDSTGRVNLAIPSSPLKLHFLGHERQPSPQRFESRETRLSIAQRVFEGLLVDVEFGLLGSTIRLRDFLGLRAGGVIDLGIACDGTASVLINGTPKFRGEVVHDGHKLEVAIKNELPASRRSDPMSPPG